jgi:hypothetical protein
MAWTYDTLLSAVTQYMDGQSDTFFGSVFPVCVRQAEERILHATKTLPFRRYSQFTTTGDGTVSSIFDFVAPIAAYINDTPLLNKEFSWVQEVYGATTGTPVAYAIRQKRDDETTYEFVFAPNPGGGVFVDLEYYAKPLSLTQAPEYGPGTTTSTWIARNAENALLFGTLFHVYVYEKGEDDISNRYKEDFEKALALLKTISRNDMRRDEFRASIQPQE